MIAMSRIDLAGRRTRRRPSVRSILLALSAAALLPAAPIHARPQARAAALPAAQPAFSLELRDAIARRAGSDLRGFYAARSNRPLWLSASGTPLPAAQLLLRRMQTADYDGIKSRKLKHKAVAKALNRARNGRADDLAKADVALSKGFADYVKRMRGARRADMIYESEALAPVVPTATAALQAAASAPSLDRYVETMAWMHPLYAPMRDALGDRAYGERQRVQLVRNLERIRALPANPGARYVLIDAAGARLWMYKDGRVVDSMRVVVGKADQQTPAMAGFLRYAIVNPYWNVPEDLVRSRIAANVLDKGAGYLRAGGYQLLSDWTDRARPIDASTVDWRAVFAGQRELRVRQLPGGDNFMGKVKFMFPNDLGIYLHDTPDKQLMLKDQRQFSSGCVRLENADKLGRWLLGKPLPRRLRDPEQQIDLPQVVPVYITYLTAMPENGRIAFRSDVYARDGLTPGAARLASN